MRARASSKSTRLSSGVLKETAALRPSVLDLLGEGRDDHHTSVMDLFAEDATRLVEVEVDNLDQLREVLKVDGIDVILLDNMDCPRMAEAVQLRNGAASASSGQASRKGKVELEASGGVTLETVRPIALTGVERIAVGAITHSAPALDIGLDVEPS